MPNKEGQERQETQCFNDSYSPIWDLATVKEMLVVEGNQLPKETDDELTTFVS